MRWDAEYVLWGLICKVTLSVLSPNGLFLLQGAQIALNVRVSVFYSQVHHGERSQVSVRCQVATCLCVFKAAVAWIVFTAQRARHRGVVGGQWRRGEGALTLI